QSEAAAESLAVLHGRYEHAHGDRKHRGQHAAQDQNHPPDHCEKRVGLRQDGKELPLLACTQTIKHSFYLNHNCRLLTCHAVLCRSDCSFEVSPCTSVSIPPGFSLNRTATKTHAARYDPASVG